MPAVTLSKKHRIEIPKEIREAMGWKPGDRLVFIPDGNCVRIMRVPQLAELEGITAGADKSGYRYRSDRF